MPDFNDLLKESNLVFKDKGVLSPHYVPEDLLYREAELRKVMLCLLPSLNNQKPRNLFIYGKTGTGKTASTKQVMQKLLQQQSKHVAALYMNCRVYDSRYKVLQKVITEFKPDFAKTGYSFTILYEKLLDWIEENALHSVLFLDEVDAVKDLDNLIYTLTRANDDLHAGSISVVGISNKVGFKQRLDQRSKSSLCEEELIFAPYDASQLKGILEQRSKRAFKDGVVTDPALNLAAAIAAGENGDARYALSLLLRAGELAEKHSLTSISENDVEESRKAADEDKAFELVSSLPEHQQLLLYGLALLHEQTSYKRLIEDGEDKFFFSGEVYEKYSSICKKFGREPRTSRWYREYLHELELLGLVSAVSSGKGIRGHTNLLKLCYDSSKIKSVIEKTLLLE
ncbi:AAA family ATPase [Candidatus Micrarchaeota archaeon]|nr:AAA family ATPase [Candidatus Micrarchaeota archaeon]